MEGLRGFAVALVFLVHYISHAKAWLSKHPFQGELSSALHTVGNTGVDLFFVLSGYLIYGSLMPRGQSFSHFLLRRLERLYPAFTAVFVAYVVLSLVFPEENKIPPAHRDAAVYLLQNFLLLPGIFPIEPLITVA